MKIFQCTQVNTTNRIQNRNIAFSSGYSMVGTPYGSSRPIEEWEKENGGPLPPLEYYVQQNRNKQNGTTPKYSSGIKSGNIQIQSSELDSLKNITNKLKNETATATRNFLFNAIEVKGNGYSEPLRRHISYTFKEMSKDEESKKAFKGILDKALSSTTREESQNKVAANNAYLIDWFLTSLPEENQEEYIIKKYDFIKQARIDLGQPNWETPGIAYQSDRRYSGPRYS